MKRMKTVWKRVWAVVLTLSLLVAMVSVSHAEDTPAFQVGDMTYSCLRDALDAAEAGEDKTVVMVAESYTLTESVEIPAGVTLLLPYSKDDLTVNGTDATLPYANSESYGNESVISWPGENTVHLLTLAEQVTMTVGQGAAVVLGGQFSSSGAGLGGQTYGAHSDMVLNERAQILVKDGGILSTNGYITGEGTISVTNGGAVYEPFVVTDYHGGTYTAALFMGGESISPFNSYSMFNIQCDMSIDGSSFLYGYCNLFAGGAHNTTTATIIGPCSENSKEQRLLHLDSSATVSFTYDDSCKVPTHYNIGRTTLSVDGDASLGILSLKVSFGGKSMTVKTSSVEFPIPYNLKIVQQSGVMEVANPVKLMPGAEVEVKEGAKLLVSHTLLVYDGFVSKTDGAQYPDGTELSAAGLPERARLIVNGEMELTEHKETIRGVETTVGAVFAGTVETNGAGVIVVGEMATLGTVAQEGACTGDGVLGYVVSVTDRTEYDLPAQVGDYRDPGAYLTLEAGKTYYAVNDDVVESDTGYAYMKYSDSTNYEDKTVEYATAEEIRGTWATYFIAEFDANGGAFPDGSTAVSGNYLPGEEICLPYDDPERSEGGVFGGWEDYEEGAVMGRGDVVYKAIWKTGLELTTEVTGSGIELNICNYDEADAEGCVLFVAAYDENGKMISVEIEWDISVSGGEGSEGRTLAVPAGAAEVRVFLLNEDNLPLAEHLTLELNQ